MRHTFASGLTMRTIDSQRARRPGSPAPCDNRNDHAADVTSHAEGIEGTGGDTDVVKSETGPSATSVSRI